MAAASERIAHLDGLRGIAALIVILAHIAAGFVPAMYFGADALPAPQWQVAFATSPFFVTINGSFAVYVFFVLSGYVITGSAIASRSSAIANSIARVARLSLPCAASVLLSAALLNPDLNWVVEAARIVNYKWLQNYVGSFSDTEILRQAFGGYYFTGRPNVNPVLWTMQRELLGSVSIYLAFGFIKDRSSQLAGCAAIALILVIFDIEPECYLCFVAGAALFLTRDSLRMLPSWIGLALLLIGLLLGGRPFIPPTPDSFYYPAFLLSPKLYSYLWTIGAVCLLTGALVSTAAREVLSSRACRFLGRISFGVYLVHFPLLKSVMSYLYVAFGRFGHVELVVSASLYVAAVIAVGFLFTILVDEPATRASQLIRSVRFSVVGRRQGPLAPPRR